jgi:hypothetical protein
MPPPAYGSPLPHFYQVGISTQEGKSALARKLLSKLVPGEGDTHLRLNSPLWSLLNPNVDMSLNIRPIQELLDQTEFPLEFVDNNFPSTRCFCHVAKETCGCVVSRVKRLSEIVDVMRPHLALTAELLAIIEHERRTGVPYGTTWSEYFERSDVVMVDAY